MRIVVLGAAGQIGWELTRALAPLGEVTALDRRGRDGLEADLDEPDGLRRTLRHLRPDVVANAAAWTNVDGAESEPERARRVNAEAVGVLAAEAKRLDAWLVHYSTDYVFDGTGTRPWREDDAAGPLNAYGRTKWEGEQAIRSEACRHLIFRTQWVYSPRRGNFVLAVLRAAAEQDRLEVVADQIGAPTGADLVADVTAHAVRAATARQELAGTYHLAARGETSRHALARFVVESARRAGRPLRVTGDGVVPVTSGAGPTVTPRPRNSRLDVARLERTFGLRLPDWRAGVERALAEAAESRPGNGVVPT